MRLWETSLATTGGLRRGHTKSCGCASTNKFVDLGRQRFGRLVVLRRAKTIKKHITWLCRCDCGNEVEVYMSGLKSGDSKSCGCLRKEVTGMLKLSHNKCYERIYTMWRNIIQRCTDSNNTRFDRYGGRGIAVCDEWRSSFEAFDNWAEANGYEDHLEIDRKDNDGNYCPENCWFTNHSLNVINRGRMKSNTSGYTGVSYSKLDGMWVSYIGYAALKKKRLIYLGRFHSKELALETRNQFIIDNNLPHQIQEWRNE